MDIETFLHKIEDIKPKKELFSTETPATQTSRKATRSKVPSPLKTPIPLDIDGTEFSTPSDSTVTNPPPIQKKKGTQKTNLGIASSSRTLFKETATPKRSIRIQKLNSDASQQSTLKPPPSVTTRSSARNRVSKTPSTIKPKQNDQTPSSKKDKTIGKLSLLGSCVESDRTALMKTFRHIGDGYRLLTQFKCAKSIQAFEKLTKDQLNTGWVLSQIGRNYYEMMQLEKAKGVYERIRKLEPCRLSGMEYYSTILWHDKKAVELSFLANELSDIDHLSPQSWCVVGNCFSVQKKHKSAIKFFERAIQLDPHFTYAYTLIGHEYLAQETWDKAVLYFRDAIRIDPRHYNAWYGLGTVYYHQGRYDYAEYHLKKAVQIHQQSSVLFCSVGIVLISTKRIKEALHYFDLSLKLDPHNPLSRFKKAYVLYLLGNQEDSIGELEELKYYAPKDASIYYLLGKMYRQLNIIDKAMDNLSQALDLEPKNPDQIKKALEDLKNNVDDDEEDYSSIFELQHI